MVATHDATLTRLANAGSLLPQIVGRGLPTIAAKRQSEAVNPSFSHDPLGLRFWLVVLGASLAGPVRAEDGYRLEDVAPKFVALANASPKWLDERDVPLATTLPDKATTEAEISTLLALQDQRTPEQLRLIRSEVGDLALVFVKRLGRRPDRLPKSLGLLHAVLAEVDHFLFTEKIQLLRSRPHQVDPRIRPAIPVPQHPAFPSGRAGEARALAIVLGDLLPAEASQLLRFAAEVGRRREIAGVHFPSDTAEGARIGQAVADKLLSLKEFQVLVGAARHEWEAVPPAP